jgi:hypothetical protein
MDTVEPNGRSEKVDTVNSLGTVDTLEKVAQVEIEDTVGRSVHRGIQWDTMVHQKTQWEKQWT